ncbi:LOW QUALITY PROTEIN: E3 ubiquitin-protein ligase SHPRH [Daphnia magna]|uniref:LOW QUALITY PROTEIN: E3 ubiquitin-protein ligase SHPRH n=1 Tax=Daphnia magna TaxID=35525 RepID=UPI001E1BA145|nr:LOW QUALITY PROTEIN: E3 ubiquitin-protein ligase SHPRH [Daphnia magna]
MMDSTEISESISCSSQDEMTPTAEAIEQAIDYDALYDRVNLKSELLENRSAPLTDVQHESLVPELRIYQTKAVNWMLKQERCSSVKGGILADEMGLGKTVEVLALILNNAREKLSDIEYQEPLTEIKAQSPEKIPQSEAKRAKIEDQCTKCANRTIGQTIENVIWRFSPDNEKSTIQKVIDLHCGDIQNENPKVTRKKMRCCLCPKQTVRERLNNHYNDALAEFSCLKSLQRRSDAVNEDTITRILCVCGKTEAEISPLVQCPKCKTQQHSNCIHYDLTDPLRGPYLCPQCWAEQEPIESCATLIITPSTICTQWVEEIKRHVRDRFRILVYQGVHGQGYHQPVQLARGYDVIITTYEILRKELYFAEVKTGQKRTRRKAATYMAPPSPLLSVRFWRLCLDEAQMVEGSATRAAEMARKFHTVHRWCVTGTPIQKSVQDLHGLFMFLDVAVDRRVLFNPVGLVDVLAPIFWRTRKSAVTEQIQLPEQTDETHWLSFSAVEQHFYQQQQAQCAQDATVRFLKFSGDLKTKISSLDPHTLKVLLFPLLRLRQACVHPQMVRGQFLTLRPQTKTLTMEELLCTLIKRAQLECEESQRLRVSAANGQAALHIIQEEWAQAAEKYRDVIRWAEEIKDSVKTDTLQRLHTFHNLAEIIRTAPPGAIPPTLRDSQLQEEADQLKKHYLGRALGQVESARATLATLTLKVTGFKTELEVIQVQMDEIWWTALIQWSDDANISDKLVEEVKDKLTDEAHNSKMTSQFSGFNSVNALKFLLFSRLEELEEQRKAVTERMRWLEVTSIERLSQDASDCHLRPLQGRRKKDRCPICIVHDQIEDYESLLFRMADRKNQEDEWDNVDEDAPAVLEALRRGTWADSEAERILKHMLQFARKHTAPQSVQDGGSVHLKLLDACKKEFRQIRVVWRQLNDQASAVDELSMATLRLRLRLPHELPQPKPTVQMLDNKNPNQVMPIYLLEPHDVDIQYGKLNCDLTVAGQALKRHMGHVLYLKNLEMAGFGKTGNQNPDPCPVCQCQLGEKWSVLVCGHSFCMDCIELLISQSHSKLTRKLKCAICRDTTALFEIAYVDAQADASENPSLVSVQVKGSHSTKVQAVVQQLLLIKKDDPSAKCLVFSTWVDVLLIVGRALDENGISYCSLFSNNSQVQLNRFKRDPTVTVLLIPVQSGANGLNLVEATHVLLMEPILNPGSELQAIGRVHRIGQTKPTVVHRFLVKHTIEEKMALMLDKHRSALTSKSSISVKENPVTLADLKDLFNDHTE